MEAPYRKPVGRDDPGAPFSGGGGDSLKRNSSKKKNPPVTACGGDSPLSGGDSRRPEGVGEATKWRGDSVHRRTSNKQGALPLRRDKGFDKGGHRPPLQEGG